MSTNPLTNEQNQSTSLTKKSILIKPDNDQDLQDLIFLQKRVGKKYHDSLARLSEKYHFSERDYKKDRITITLDFSAFDTIKEQQAQQEQENKNSEDMHSMR